MTGRRRRWRNSIVVPSRFNAESRREGAEQGTRNTVFVNGKKEANYGSTQNRKEYGSDEQQ
jgi:hypothetical protein